MGPEWLVITPSGKMLQRRGKRLEAGSIQECQGRYRREEVWRDGMTWGLWRSCRYQDKSLVYSSPYLSTHNSNHRARGG